MKSKETQLLELFFNHPTRQWHFEALLREASITRSKASLWLKKFIQEGFIKRIKPQGKMPYYVSKHESAAYRNRKRLYAQQQLYESGLLNYLHNLSAETVVLFGSFARSDWHAGSDVDVFVYGDEELDLSTYETTLHREIQVFTCKNNEELEKYGAGLVNNIQRGTFIKGNVVDMRV
ncbi:MAG: nucleotidyltransferase domain-containing protein [Candidatus Woesearchaeota archaeon]|nr:nucleotidyltransferase domain-containing protein [Candidatus Woesearchaeota archaeon]